MKYFELFDTPVDLFPDQRKLKATYYALSRLYHPDAHAGVDTEEQIKTLEKSGQINEAYQIMKELNSRLKYMLEEWQVLSGDNESPDAEFLMEMMELNESVMESTDDEEKRAQAETKLDDHLQSITDDLQTEWEKVKDGQPDKEQLERLKGHYYRMRYILRIQDNLSNFVAPE